MKDSRQRIDIIKDALKDAGSYDKLIDAIYETINCGAKHIAEQTGLDSAMIGIALNEMIGINDNKYSAKEINNEVDEWGILDPHKINEVDEWIPDDWTDTAFEREVMIESICKVIKRDDIDIADAARLLGYCD